jgi:hypothetical protein
MRAGLDGCGHLPPVVNTGVKHADFVAANVFGGEDLEVAKALANSVLPEAVDHEGKKAAGEQQAGYATADHKQGHQCAAAIAKRITKG